MELLLISLAFAVWYVSGVLSFIFWWTSEYDLTASEVVLALLCGILGPVSFFIGWCLHVDDETVLIKRRK